MKQKIKGVYIREQDIQLFRYLHAVKVSTYRQITRDIYVNHTEDSVANRVRKMENNKLLEGYRSRTLHCGKQVITLTQKGFDNFVRDGIEARIELKSGCIEHDLSLVDIRYHLLKQEKVKMYLTENEMHTWGHILDEGRYSSLVGLRSDAIVEIQAPRRILKVPVEYNSSHKSVSRYLDLLDRYYSRDDIPIVLFVYRTEEDMNKIKEVEKKKFGTGRLKFFYALKKNIAKSETVKFYNCNGDELKL